MQAAIKQNACIHCGTLFRPTAHRPDFCCTGCQFVHDLIADRGLGQFYDLQEGGVPPVPSLVFQKRDYAWLEKAGSGEGTLTLGVQGVSCIGCAWLIEKLFANRPGALAIHVDPTRGQLTLHFQPAVFHVVGFARELQTFGYLVGPHGDAAQPPSRALNLRLGLCAALAMNTMLFTLPRYLGMAGDFEFAPLFHRLTLILGTLSFLIGGSYFFVRSWHSLRQRVLHIDFPISLGLIAAYAGSLVAWARGELDFVYFDFVSTFTFLMLAGRWLQQKAIERNRSQLLASQAAPPPVHDATTGGMIEPAALLTGALFTVDPGHTVPVRSRLESVAATLGLEWINGESETVTARGGRTVQAGAVNRGAASITLKALEPWSESLLARLLLITPGAAPRDRTLERFLRGYIVAVLTIAAGGFLGWWHHTGSLLPALQVFISVLVVSCPCASGVALPLACDLAASRLRRFGVFIRNSEIWTKLERVHNVIFDKTGTLTLETISLRNPESMRQLSDDERAALLAMVHDSLHPVSACLREQLLADGVKLPNAGPPQEAIGLGLEMDYDSSTWRLGRPEWSSPGSAGETIFTRDGQVLANFQFGEEARADAREEVNALEKGGCRVFILSGDRRAKVETMADHLGIARERCQAEMSPDQKADWVRRFDAHDTLYVGDGANDSLAFDAAWCSGTPAIDRGLLEQKADFYFLGRGLGGVRALLQIAAARRHIARAVVGFAIAYNAIVILLSLAGKMNPLLAAVLMPASSLVSLAIVVVGLSCATGSRLHPAKIGGS